MNAISATALWDWISVSAMAVIWYPLIQYILTLDTTYIWYLVGMWGTHFITVILKLWTFRALSNQSWVKRPEDAMNCDIMCRNGDSSGRPGFPSGHMGHAAFFCGFVSAMAIHKKISHKHIIVLAGTAYVVLTGMARYYKKCHNVEQIVAGTALGGVMGVAFYGLAATFACYGRKR